MKSTVAMIATCLFSMTSLTISTAQALNFDSDVPSAIQTQMVQDLNFIAQLTGSGATPFHQQIFSITTKEVSGADYKRFFDSRIYEVGLDSCGGGAAVACVQPFFNPNKMWLTNNFINFSHPQVARMMVVFHESRHSESKNGNWRHNTCPRPFLDENGKDMVSIWTGAKLEGQPACDATAFGSYGSSTVMLKNIFKYCANCTDLVKQDADMYAMNQLGRVNVAKVKADMLADFQK